MTQFEIVVAVDMKNGIGRNGQIPWDIPADRTRFRDLTLYGCCEGAKRPFHQRPNIVIMGRKTWQSLSRKPLPGRINIVVSSTFTTTEENVLTAKTFTEALEIAEGLMDEDAERCFVIGGSQLYEEALAHPGCKNVYLTRVMDEFDCDVFFPASKDLHPLEVGGVQDLDGLMFQFITYTRKACVK